MTSKVGIYESHEKALLAVKALNTAHFPLNKVSLLGKAEIIDDHLHVKSCETAGKGPVVISAIAGPVLGILTGLGLFAIPGFGFLYGAGALIGAIAGFDIGLVGSGIITILVALGFKKESVVKYEEHLNEGKFLVVVQGDLKEIKAAEHILHTEGSHIRLEEGQLT